MSLSPGTEWWRHVPAPAAGADTLVGPEPHAASGGAFAFRALMALTFIMFIAPQSFLPALAPLRIALLAAVAGIVAHVAGSLSNNRPVTVRTAEMGLTAALVVLAVASVPISFWPGGSVSFLLEVYFKTVAVFWLLGNVVDTLPRLRRVIWALSLMAIPLALTGVKNYLTGGFIVAGHSVKRIQGYDSGLTGNPNDLALTLNLVLSLSLGLLFSARTAFARGLLVAIVLVEVAGVVVTFSRSGFLTLATIGAVYVWRLARRGRAGCAATVLVACLLGFAVLPSEYVSRIATITDMESDNTGSSQERWSDMVAALGFVLANPVTGAGVGMGTQALNDVRGAAWLQVHNVYLELALELGVLGLVVFLLLLGACLRKVRNIRRATGGGPELSELSRLAEGIEIALLAFVVAAFFYPVAYHFYFYYIAGLSVAAGVVHRQLSAA
jgi:putative inorganic carbon (HCO3(-)) transporter